MTWQKEEKPAGKVKQSRVPSLAQRLDPRLGYIWQAYGGVASANVVQILAYYLYSSVTSSYGHSISYLHRYLEIPNDEMWGNVFLQVWGGIV